MQICHKCTLAKCATGLLNPLPNRCYLLLEEKKRLWTAQPVFKMSICRFLSAVSCLEFAVGEENLHSSDGKGQKSENMDWWHRTQCDTIIPKQIEEKMYIPLSSMELFFEYYSKTCFPFPQLKPRYPQKFRGVLEFKSSKRVFERLAVTNLRFTNCSWAFQRRTSAALRTCPYLGARETLKPDRQIWHLLRPNNVLTYSTIDTSLFVFGCKMISKRAASSTRGQEDKKMHYSK